jgi:SPRY domain-containing SOCS box protein 3
MEHWFEVEMEAPFQGQARMVGLGDKTTRLQSSSKDFFPLIGRDVSSWGINYDGVILHDGNRLPYADVDTTHDKPLRIGVYYDSYHGYITFSIDDKNYGVAFNNVTIGLELFPMICSTSRNSNVKLIYSHSSIISLKALCRGSIRLYIKEIKDIESLPIPIHQKSYLLFKNYEMPKSIKDYIIV